MFRLPYPGGELRLGGRVLVMGILNVTPDSFSDSGRFLDPDRAVRKGIQMSREGADLIDIGGESTRPGSSPVSAGEELRRILPVIERLASRGTLLSVDTSKASVAREAFRAGARILNDVCALRGDAKIARTAAEAGVPVLLMHMRGTPRTMQKRPRYGDLVADLCVFFRKAVQRALRAGISHDRIILDPGIGFGKTPEHNLDLLRRLEECRSLGFPLAIGTSRKRFIGHVLDRPVNQRMWGTAATVAAAVLRGVHMVRVHDVREMVDVVRMAESLRCCKQS